MEFVNIFWCSFGWKLDWSEKKNTVQLKKFVIPFSKPTKIHYLNDLHGKLTKFPPSKCGSRVWIWNLNISCCWNVFIGFDNTIVDWEMQKTRKKFDRKQNEMRQKRFLIQFFPSYISIFMKFIASFCWPLREHRAIHIYIEWTEKSGRRSRRGCSAQNHHYKVEYNNEMGAKKNPFIWKSVKIIFIDIVIFFCFLIAFFSFALSFLGVTSSSLFLFVLYA